LENWLIVGAILLIPGVLILWTLWIRLAGAQKSAELQRKDERRHAEQLEWRRTGRLPVRYVTTYEPGEMVDEDMARMLELGYEVVEDWLLANGGRQVIYRLPGIPAL
jgi:hypothetical protein